MIYYERKQVREVPPLPNPLPESIQTENEQQTEGESPTDRMATPLPLSEPERNIPLNDDAASTTSSTETPAPITRNNTTRYSLREAPVPKTCSNFLVHGLQAKPAVLKIMQRKTAIPKKFHPHISLRM